MDPKISIPLGPRVDDAQDWPARLDRYSRTVVMDLATSRVEPLTTGQRELPHDCGVCTWMQTRSRFVMRNVNPNTTETTADLCCWSEEPQPVLEANDTLREKLFQWHGGVWPIPIIRLPELRRPGKLLESLTNSRHSGRKARCLGLLGKVRTIFIAPHSHMVRTAQLGLNQQWPKGPSPLDSSHAVSVEPADGAGPKRPSAR